MSDSAQDWKYAPHSKLPLRSAPPTTHAPTVTRSGGRGGGTRQATRAAPVVTKTSSGGGGGRFRLPSPHTVQAKAGDGEVALFWTNPAISPYGAKGKDVEALQQFLIDQNVFPEKLVTGYYRILTQNAVERFQRKFALPTTGALDDMTRLRIREIQLQ